jgi:hypothetical protein
MTDKALLALEERRFAAMIGRDFGTLEALVHDGLLYTHSSGRVNTALINGRAPIEAEIGGQPKTLKLLFLNAWTRTPQGRQFVAWQSTPLPA